MMKIIMHWEWEDLYDLHCSYMMSWQEIDGKFEYLYDTSEDFYKKDLFWDDYSLKALHDLFGGYTREGNFGVRGKNCEFGQEEVTPITVLAKGLKMVLMVCHDAANFQKDFNTDTPPETIEINGDMVEFDGRKAPGVIRYIVDFSLWPEGWKWIYDNIKEPIEIHIRPDQLHSAIWFCMKHNIPAEWEGKSYSGRELWSLEAALEEFTPEREQNSFERWQKFESHKRGDVFHPYPEQTFTPEQFLAFFPSEEYNLEWLTEAVQDYKIRINAFALSGSQWDTKYPVLYGIIRKGEEYQIQEFHLVKYPTLAEEIADLAEQIIPEKEIDSVMIVHCDLENHATLNRDYAKEVIHGIEINNTSKEIILIDKYDAIPAFHKLVKKLPENWKI